MIMCVGKRFRQFKDDTFGGITALTITVFIIMMASVGMAVDFMRHETLRAELQDAVDRGVLAAAAFNQTVDMEKTVRGYIKSTNFVKNGYNLKVKNNSAGGVRRIEAVASYQVDTFFLKLVGINTLDIQARGEALEGVGDVEISLVLDISGSMAELSDNSTLSRIEILRSSASKFVTETFKRSTNGTLTFSLIPYAGGVNAGPTVFNELVHTEEHNYSRCVCFNDGDYVDTMLPPLNSRDQIQHFETNRSNNSPHDLLGWGACPTNEQNIEYFSTNETKLVNRIKGLKGHDFTGTFDGMKWANMLSDPSFNSMTQKLVSAGEVDAAQASLPAPFNANGAEKYIILMSDGNTTRTQEVKSQKYQTSADHQHFAQNRANDNELWQPVNGSENRARLLEACTAAKNNGVIVFTIGFDIQEGSNAQTDLRTCATEGNFFDVKGTKLLDAFDKIAATIQKLKLTI